MGNFIKTKNGIEISLGIPAQISSFEEKSETNNSHITKGKLKVFSVGNTGDIREFTKEFSDNLIQSLPGTPVVAHYIEDKEDFEGHDSTQYVYGYVPENAVPEFVEEDGKLWATVDVNLFTERDDNIGQVASKIIGKAQSLELNPDTVDYELIYINNKLEKIKFKKGSFYGLSVLGDDQPPAFEGAGFFTKEVIDQFKALDKPTDFMSLGLREKIERFTDIIYEMKVFSDFFYVETFTEEEVIVMTLEDGMVERYAAPYKWEGEDKYQIGDFKKVMITYTEKENNENFTDNADSSESKVANPMEDGVNYKKEDEKETQPEVTQAACGEPENKENCEKAEPEKEPEDKEEPEKEEPTNCEKSEPENSEDKEKGKDDEESEGKFQEQSKEEEKVSNTQNSSTEFAALSSEERDELNALRTEKKQTLINSFKEYLEEEVIKSFEAKINEYDFASLERELKIASFDSNKDRMNKNESTTINTYLPHTVPAQETKMDRLARLVSENI